MITDRRSLSIGAWLQVMALTAGGCSWRAPPPAAENRPRWQSTHPELLSENVFKSRREGSAVEPGPALSPEIALQVYYEIWRFKLAGQPGGLEPLWDHLEEGAADPEQALLLRRNGIRIGVGKESSWPAVREIVLQGQPQVWRTEGAVAQGETIQVELDQLGEEVPVFYFDPADGLVGSRCGGGTMAFQVEHALSMEELDLVSLRITPQLRRETSGLSRKLQRSADGRESDTGQSFDALACNVVLRPGQYVIIGPSRASGMAHLVGSVFLVSRDGESISENLYCIVPRIYRWTPGKSGDAAVGEGSTNETGEK